MNTRFMEPLPRVDGLGMFCRAIRSAMADLGVGDADARAWTRIMASAARGTCWPRSAVLICEREHASGEMPAALATFFKPLPEGFVLTREGYDWMLGVRQNTRLRQGFGGQAGGEERP